MTEELQIQKELMEDLLGRLSGKGKKGKEAAIEALAVSTEDEDWRPDELIRQGGVEIIRDLLFGEEPAYRALCPGDLSSPLQLQAMRKRLSVTAWLRALMACRTPGILRSGRK